MGMLGPMMHAPLDGGNVLRGDIPNAEIVQVRYIKTRCEMSALSVGLTHGDVTTFIRILCHCRIFARRRHRSTPRFASSQVRMRSRSLPSRLGRAQPQPGGLWSPVL